MVMNLGFAIHYYKLRCLRDQALGAFWLAYTPTKFERIVYSIYESQAKTSGHLDQESQAHMIEEEQGLQQTCDSPVHDLRLDYYLGSGTGLRRARSSSCHSENICEKMGCELSKFWDYLRFTIHHLLITKLQSPATLTSDILTSILNCVLCNHDRAICTTPLGASKMKDLTSTTF